MGFHRFTLFLPALMLMANLAIAQSGQEFVVGSFVFAVPKGWQLEEPSSPMRKAELKVSDPKTGAVAETVFFCFGPGQGGSVAENIARWKGQISGPDPDKVEEKEIAGTKVTMVKLVGTYQSGMPGGMKLPQAGSRLLGVILENFRGDVFARLTGPDAWVDKIEKDFVAMIENGAKNKKE